jgi:hypothetical protein
MLAYAHDADTSRGWLTTLPEFARPRMWAAGVLGPSAGIVSPRAAVANDTLWLTRAIAGESPALAVPTAAAELNPPQVVLVADSAAGVERRLDLAVRPAPGTYSIRLRAVDTRVLSSAVAGRKIDPSQYRTRPAQWTLGFVDPQPPGFSLTLVVPRGQTLQLDVVARSLGLPQTVMNAIPRRPDGVVPINAADQTAVHRILRF